MKNCYEATPTECIPLLFPLNVKIPLCIKELVGDKYRRPITEWLVYLLRSLSSCLIKVETCQNSKSCTDHKHVDSCDSLENKIFYSSIKLYFTVVFTK